MPDLILSALSVSRSSFSAAIANSIASIVVGSTLSACLFHRLSRSNVSGFQPGSSRLDQFAALLIGFSIFFGFFDHLFDIIIRQSTRGLDCDLLLFSGALVHRTNRHNTVGVDVKCHLDLRQSARSWGDILKIETDPEFYCLWPSRVRLGSTRIVTAFWLSSAVEKICDFFVGIVVLRSIKRVKHAPSVSMPKRQWCDVEKNNVFDVTLQNTRLNRRTHGNNFIGVHTLDVALYRKTWSLLRSRVAYVSYHQPEQSRRCPKLARPASLSAA